MSESEFKSPDRDALLALLGQAKELCQKLGLAKDAATFESFITRLKTEKPIDEDFCDEVSGTISGPPALRIVGKLGRNSSEFARLQADISKALCPEIGENEERRSSRQWKAVEDSNINWQLEGESDLSAATIPHPPQAGVPTIVRLTHSNSYGPFDEAEFFVRIGDPDEPTDSEDLDSATDWEKAELIEELVFVDDEQMLRSEAEEPFEDETPWSGTYEAQLVFPAGRHLIEIKIVSGQPGLLASRVLADWEVSVG